MSLVVVVGGASDGGASDGTALAPELGFTEAREGAVVRVGTLLISVVRVPLAP